MLSKILNISKKIIVIDIIIIIPVLITWWFVSENHSFLSLINYFFIGGAVSIIIGYSIIKGGNTETRSFEYQYARSASNIDINKRSIQDFNYILHNYFHAYNFIFSGISIILIGAAIHIFFK